jgi:hypothetical protein
MLLAPGTAGAGAMQLPGASEGVRWNPDAHLVPPETRQEIVRGELVEAQPARPGHGDTHARLDAVVSLSVAPGYVASSDLLTRRSADSDFATDTCVRKIGRNPETGYRWLEELSFEVFFTQSGREARERARDVISSGVRRMFGLFVSEGYFDGDVDGDVAIAVHEWSRERNDWIELEHDEVIEDPCLCAPLPVRALVHAAAADDAVVQALAARRNPALEQLRAESQVSGFRDGEAKGFRDGEAKGFRDGEAKGFRDGEAKGQVANQRQVLLDVLAHRGIELDASQAERIAACEDLATLRRWFLRALNVSRADELLG